MFDEYVNKNIVQSRNITIKQRLPNIFIIDSGLSASDKILLEGVQIVNDDDTIIPEMKPIEQVINSSDKK